MVRNNDRHRLRAETERAIQEIADADWDETSEVVADVAAKTAARTASRLGRPDSDAPSEARTKWHQSPQAKAGGIVALVAAIGAILQALRELGVLK